MRTWQLFNQNRAENYVTIKMIMGYFGNKAAGDLNQMELIWSRLLERHMKKNMFLYWNLLKVIRVNESI